MGGRGSVGRYPGFLLPGALTRELKTCPLGRSPGGGLPFLKLTRVMGSLEFVLCPAVGKGPGSNGGAWLGSGQELTSDR